MIGSLIAGFLSLLVFLCFQAQGIFTGDSGDVVTAAATGGVPHPPGYPLYTFVGWVLSHMPFLTASWRVTLLSSIPHAITVALVYAFIYRMTKGNKIASLFGALSLGTNYLFFLYSVTPEVFALFDVFIISVWYLLFVWAEEKRITSLYGATFLYGLSLSHHHLMIFMAPAIAFFVWKNKRLLPLKHAIGRTYGFLTAWFIIGFLPYLYIPFSAHGNSIINWDRATNWAAFVRLITRADYGTFVSGGAFGQTIYERLLAIAAYGTFIRVDWTWIGVILVAVGVSSWFRRSTVWFWTWIIAVLCIGPLFFFYASFPIVNRFTLGTYERFLLPSYVFFAIASGVGLSSIVAGIERFLSRLTKNKREQIGALIGTTFLLVPLFIGGMTIWRFWGLPQDRTAEYLGRDVLSGAAMNSIVLLSHDTSLFTTQYVRYVLGVRSDLAVIHAARLPLADYQHVLKQHFPRLVYPDVSPSMFVPTFVSANSAASTRVYSNVALPLEDGWYWVPRGLLFEAVSFKDLPPVEEMYGTATEIMTKFHDPRLGVLSRYPHLMLSDILDVYANAHIAVGKTLVRADKWKEAKQEFTKAVKLSGDMSHGESLELLGLTQLYFKECEAALQSFKDAERASYFRSSVHLKLESMTYGECFGDEKRAHELFLQYEALEKQSEEPLETL